jgi:hypothetical protein
LSHKVGTASPLTTEDANQVSRRKDMPVQSSPYLIDSCPRLQTKLLVHREEPKMVMVRLAGWRTGRCVSGFPAPVDALLATAELR